MSDATESVVAAIAAAGKNDKVVFAAWDRIAKDDFGGDDVAFKDFRMLDNLCLVDKSRRLIKRMNCAKAILCGGRGVEGAG